MESNTAQRLVQILLDEFNKNGADFSEWEHEFLISMADQLESGTKPTVKQENVLRRIQDKAGL